MMLFWILGAILLNVMFLAVPVLIIWGIVKLVRKLSGGSSDRQAGSLSNALGMHEAGNAQGRQDGTVQASAAVPASMDERDLAWRRYIAGFREKFDAVEVQEVLDAILQGTDAPDRIPEVVAAEEDGQAEGAVFEPTEFAHASHQVAGGPAHVSAAAHGSSPQSAASAAPRQEIDGTLLLLYFGAFLFVASAGLFVAFAGFSGVVRTLIVVMVMAVLYFGGFKLHSFSRRLQPAGVAFVAIGMAIAPLVGVAAYHYIAVDQHGHVIWLLTSILCIGMYAYAFLRLRLVFLSYLFIFSFLSLFESAVAVTDGQVRNYIWGLIVAGMAVRAIGLKKPELVMEEPAAVSAQVMVPLGLVVSLGAVGVQGFGQLAVSLLLAAVYYTLEAVRNRPQRAGLAVAAQLLYLMGIMSGVYAFRHSLPLVGGELAFAAAAQAFVILVMDGRGEVERNFATVAFGSAVAGAALAFPNGRIMTAASAVALGLGICTAWRQRRADAYAAAGVALTALPFVVGQFLFDPRWSLTTQVIAGFVPVLVLWTVWDWFVQRKLDKDWLLNAAEVYGLSGIAVIGTAALQGGWLFLWSCLAYAATLALASRISRSSGWWASAGIAAALPIVWSLGDVGSRLFAASVLAAVVFNIVITLSCRAELNRWLVAVTGLLVPVAVGSGGLGWHAGAAGYAYLYLLTMFCLLFCRMLARGVVAASSKVPVMSFYRSASVSYVFGYISAAVLAAVISLAAEHSRLHTSVIVAVLLAAAWYIARVESRREILALEPWLVVGLLISLFRAEQVTAAGAGMVILTASLVSAVAYQLVREAKEYFGNAHKDVLDATWLLSFVPVTLCIWYPESAGIGPLVLAIAGCLTLYHNWSRDQSSREVSGLVVVTALMWAFYAAGVRNFQAYSHILAATFALYAYWRWYRGDDHTSDEYLTAMLGTATIPLGLQALSAAAGGVYGWWLLLEQVFFLMLGITIHKRFVTFWGLYVALGAVLYQLRNLGWAALSFLALFIIGMAMYRLLRTTEHRP